ncbi:MAG: ImmA/IrrE family metallo-endopeptidase [Candidatus Krumholzibacteriia bacterium]
MSEHQKLVEALLAGDRRAAAGGSPLSHGFLNSALDVAARYAKLEKLVFGNVRVVYSTASLEVDLAPSGDVVAQGEALAEVERSRLDLPAGPALELGYLIEDQGLKIIPRVFPAGSGALGGFFFDDRLGPCILLNVRASSSAIDYALAHLYGHYLADYDPYITTLCGRPDPELLEDPVELRAHQFALAFLLPRADLETYRDALGIGPGDPISVELVHHLEVYFEIDPEMVFWRLLSLGWIDAAGLQTLLAQHSSLADGLRAPAQEPAEGTLLPERFIQLVASAFGKRKLEIEDAARYLGTDIDEATRILEQFKYDDTSGRATKRGNGTARKSR